MENGVWFRLNVGRGRNADPKWLLPEICRQGEVTKKDIGAIKVFDTETLFQVDGKIAEQFAALVAERKKGGVRISPARDQTGESFALPGAPEGEKPQERPHKAAPHKDEPSKYAPRKDGPQNDKRRFKHGKRPHKDNRSKPFAK